MRRVNVNGVAVLVGRAIGGGATAASANRHRVLQAALYGTYSNGNSERFGLSSRSAPSSVTNGGVAGSMFFSAAATSLAQDHAHAHAHVHSHTHKFSPKDVVLYQYEACPFCNKVKGINQNSICLLYGAF